MLEIRYRIPALPDVPLPFAPWFARVPHARVHGFDVRFDGDVGSARLVAVPQGGSAADLARDLDALPGAPTTLDWKRTAEAPEGVAYAWRWREPIFPGVVSPMRVAWDTLDGQVLPAFTVTRDLIVHRALLQHGPLAEDLWPRLSDELKRYAGYAKLPYAVELERFAPRGPPRLADAARQAAHATAFAVGYYDSPRRASERDVALALGIREADAPAALTERGAGIWGGQS